MSLKKRYGLLAFLLALLTAASLVLSACSGVTDPVGDETTAGDGTTAGDDNTTGGTADTLVDCNYIVEAGDAKYRIVFPTGASDEVKSAAKYIKDQIQKTFGMTLEWVTDTEPAEGGEILVGLTNRQASKDAAAKLGTDRAALKTVDGNYVIVADKEWMLIDGAIALCRSLKESAGYVGAPKELTENMTYDDYARSGWKTETVPAYDSGILASKTFANDSKLRADGTENLVYSVSTTTVEQYEAYIAKLEKHYFTVKKNVDSATLKAASVTKGDINMNIELLVSKKTLKIEIAGSDSVSVEDFSYTYTKKEGDTTTFYAYGLVMDPNGIDISENKTRMNCGMLNLIKLADNSVIIIDGGGNDQMSDKARDGLMTFLREITGTKSGEKIRIACWLITHDHTDHFQGFTRFLVKYHDQVTVERMMYNVSVWTRSTGSEHTVSNSFKTVRTKILEWYPDVQYHYPAVGENITLADVSMRVMFTHTAFIDYTNGAKYTSDVNENNVSTVVKWTMDGQTVLTTGDIEEKAADLFLLMYSNAEIKCDLFQVNHHGHNRIDGVYLAANPTMTFFPQSSGKFKLSSQTVLRSVKKATKLGEAGLFYSGDETVGFAVVDGSIKDVYHAAVVGDDCSIGRWSWLS